MSGDLKHTLRKLDFPACAKELLPRLESIIASRNKQNYAMALISEFVFLEMDTRKGGGGQQNKGYNAPSMTPYKEFQLIIVLIEYFQNPSPDSTRNSVFLSLFGSNPSPQRHKVLCHLISTAISGSVAPLLSSAGAWMQQVGCTNKTSLEVARALVSDFIKFSRKISDQLKIALPLIAPNFAANLMTAVADLYMNDKPGNALTPPPDGLLEVFTEWVTENPGLCLASQQPPAGVVIAMPVSPVAGLIRWVVLAPLISQMNPVYSELHLSILQTLLDVVNTGPPTVINAAHLMQIGAHLQAYVAARVQSTENAPLMLEDAAYKMSMERFAQAIEVGIAMNCVFGNITQLWCMLQMLPPHPLMTIIINANKPAP